MPFDSTQTPRDCPSKAGPIARQGAAGQSGRSLTFPLFYRIDGSIYFYEARSVVGARLTRRQARLIRTYLWRTACKINRQPLRAEVCRWWGDLTEALQELADMASAEPVSNHGREG